ncbi:MAG: flagellar motor switch protein FliM [Pseudomonadales bacterium]|nr:flagellar motor switch protein FliM [Pseudomonadales bacterium]MCP5215362.1 flagellar motor switch protein FliM [Pseudomonadales bacterium]
MSVDELLSKDEIDVLLNGVDEGRVAVEAPSEPVQHRSTEAYDFTRQDHIVRGRLPTLEMINERFVRHTKLSMFNMLRETVEVTACAIESIKFSEYMQTFAMPTSLNMVKIRPLRGTALFVLHAELVVKLVDKFFGGGDREVNVEEREFTSTELRIIRKVLDQAFIDMKEAWKTVMPVDFEFTGTESNPAMANIINPSEVVVLSTFEIGVGESKGKFQIAIPYSMLEPVRETLDAGVQADVEDTDERWGQALKKDILYAHVPINCRIAERKITLREILSFKAGDVIPINMPDTHTLSVNGVPIFETRLGISNQHLALKIISQIKRPN